VRPDGRVNGTENLWVADATLFPSALGVNPQITIMSFAKIVARNLLAT
jgi:long-chain-alcohol oxidase